MSVSKQLSLAPFNFRELEDNSYLLTNYNGSFSFMNNRDDLKNLIGMKFKEMGTDVINDLASKNFIYSEDEKETRKSLTSSVFATDIISNLSAPALFLVVPTLRCDHDCHYCQVSRVPESTSGYSLESNHIDKIIEVINKTAAMDIKIEFQGGEPLLNQAFVAEFIERAIEVILEKNIQFVICTSLVMYPDEHLLSLSKEHNVHYSVSLDGKEEVHNQNRPNRNYNSFLIMKDNVTKLRNFLKFENVNCLATVTRTSLGDARGLVDTYREFGFQGVFLRPLSPYGFARKTMGKIGYTIDDFFEYYKEAFQYIIEINKDSLFIEESALFHLKRIFRFSDSSYVDLKSPTGHLLGVILFNYDGNVFGSDEARMLWEETKNKDLVLGNVDNFDYEKAIEKSVNLLSDTFIFESPGCRECTYSPFCGSDSMFHLSTQGDHVGNKSQSDFCKLERKMFDFIFSEFHKDGLAKKVMSKWLNQ